MELNWSTFIFEIINFVVLVWLLKRFLYKPVQQVMTRRQADIDEKLSAAKSIQAENEELNQRYLQRINDWEKERQQKRHELHKELEQERSQKLKILHQQLQQEQAKAQLNEKQRQTDVLHQLQETALKSAARFASQLLHHGAGQETETRLISLAIEALTQLSEQQKSQLVGHYGEPPSQVSIHSVFAVPENLQTDLEHAINTALNQTVSFDYQLNQELIAGIRIVIGNWVLGLNLQDELNGFMELSHEQ